MKQSTKIKIVGFVERILHFDTEAQAMPKDIVPISIRMVFRDLHVNTIKLASDHLVIAEMTLELVKSGLVQTVITDETETSGLIIVESKLYVQR